MKINFSIKKMRKFRCNNQKMINNNNNLMMKNNINIKLLNNMMLNKVLQVKSCKLKKIFHTNKRNVVENIFNKF